MLHPPCVIGELTTYLYKYLRLRYGVTIFLMNAFQCLHEKYNAFGLGALSFGLGHNIVKINV